MGHVVIYGSMRLDLKDSVMKALGLTDGQKIPNEMIARCIEAEVGAVRARNPAENDLLSGGPGPKWPRPRGGLAKGGKGRR